MKKFISLFLVVLTVLGLSSCGNGKVIDASQYALYLNVYGTDGAKYAGLEHEAEGIFAVVYDNYNNRDRYYVWGYSDNTLCCDWQWEFTPKDPASLPEIGSRIKVKGTLSKSSVALDGMWMFEAEVKTVSSFGGADGKYDTTTMSPTLTRVQLQNFFGHPAKHNGDEIVVYGRVASGNMLQHPYYDGDWMIPLEYDGKLPSIGKYVTVKGTFRGDSISEARIVVTSVKTGEI